MKKIFKSLVRKAVEAGGQIKTSAVPSAQPAIRQLSRNELRVIVGGDSTSSPHGSW